MPHPATAPDQPSLCFCTTATGLQYNRLARLLAQDLQRFVPNQPFLVLTDRPSLLADCPNVMAVPHRQRGVRPYHERRFALRRGLSLAPTVLYLDADVRICAPLPTGLSFQPGLTARSCGSLQTHLQEQFERPHLSPQRQHKRAVIEKMAQRVGINLDTPELKFINEFLFALRADGGRELDFLRYWGELAIYADTQGLHQHPTYAMALAAHKSGLPIHHSTMAGLDFFDDRIERVRIQRGQSTLAAKADYFRQQQAIEQGGSSRPHRLRRRLQRRLADGYHRLRVQTLAAIHPARLIDDELPPPRP